MQHGFSSEFLSKMSFRPTEFGGLGIDGYTTDSFLVMRTTSLTSLETQSNQYNGMPLRFQRLLKRR